MIFYPVEHQTMAASVKPAKQEDEARLNLLYEVGKKVGSASKLVPVIKKITEMTQCTLAASASSVLLFNDKEQELSFEVAAGPAGKTLKQVKLSAQSGIAGWVARHGKPLIVNDVTRDQRFNQGIDKVTGFITRSIICVPLITHRRVIGVIQVLNKLDEKDFTKRDLEALVSVASTAAMAIENAKLHQSLLDAYKSTIKALAAAIDAKDPYTRGHSQRVMEYAMRGGEALSFSEEEMETLEYAGILHDIGKIAVADNILNKPDTLTPKEWEIMREHPMVGANMLREIPFLEETGRLILHHHERYDGRGYPDGLKGDDIPLGSRLISVADAFDTMTTDRSYRPALTMDYTLTELYGCSGTQFCPVALDAFVSSLHLDARKPVSNPAPEARATANERYIRA